MKGPSEASTVARREIRASQEPHAGATHRVRHLQHALTSHRCLWSWRFAGCLAGFHRVHPPFHLGRQDVTPSRVQIDVGRINEVCACRHEPRAILDKATRQSLAPGSVKGSQHLGPVRRCPRRAIDLQPLGLLGRARFEDASVVLDRSLSGIRRFGGAHRDRDVTGKCNPLFLRFIRDGKVGVAREEPVHLDESCTGCFESANGSSPFDVVVHDERVRTIRRIAIDDPAADHDAGANQLARLGVFVPAARHGDVIGICLHVPNADDAVCDEQREEIGVIV